jgi:hypothetical protein
MVRGNSEAEVIFSYGSHDTIDNGDPLCGDIIAYRHPSFGNYTPAELARWYFCAHGYSYIRSKFDSFEGLVWLLSDESRWLPEELRSTLILGTRARDHWVNDPMRDSSENPFLDAILRKTRKQFRFTRSIKKGLAELVEIAKVNTGVKQSADKIVQRIIDADLVNGHYDWQDYIRDTKSKRKP